MSLMSELDGEMRRFAQLDWTVRKYLSELVKQEQGGGNGGALQHYRERLVLLTAGEPWEVE